MEGGVHLDFRGRTNLVGMRRDGLFYGRRLLDSGH